MRTRSLTCPPHATARDTFWGPLPFDVPGSQIQQSPNLLVMPSQVEFATGQEERARAVASRAEAQLQEARVELLASRSEADSKAARLAHLEGG